MNKLAFVLVLALGFAFGGVAAAEEAPMPPPPPASGAEQACLDALNASPELAKRVLATYNKKAVTDIDEQTIKAHKRAAEDIAENERHVIYAYAAMWLLAAGFVVFLWWRQQALKTELAALRRELDAATKDGK
jgi:hypothetical protein